MIERKVNSTNTIKKNERATAAMVPMVRHSPGTKWYEYGDMERVEQTTINLAHLKKIDEQADILLKRDCELKGQIQSKKDASEAAWLNTILIHGTAGDKVTAMQIFAQRSPVHSLEHIAALVGIVTKKNTRESFSLLGLLKDLFINELLPPKRKLIPFSMRPVDEINLASLEKDRNLQRKLILWKFESELKILYEKFITALERLAGGNVEKLCATACRYALELLLERPEQEQKLLSLLVNKLGNPNKMLATRVCGYLLQLTRKQPLMRSVVVKEVERLIYRKNITCNAQLHAISFLSQMDLHGCDQMLASTLLNIYIGLFRMLVVNKKMDEKILNALLLATNRAFPYAKGDIEKLTKEVDTLYKILHQSNFSTALQTLKLLYQLLTTSEGISDRFYAALYRRILDCQHSTNIDRQLFRLLYRALSSDSVECRVIAFIKRLLQLSLYRSAPFAAASLILISRLVEERPSLLITKKLADVSSLTKFGDDMKSDDDDDDEVYEDFDTSVEIAKIPTTSRFEGDEEKMVEDVKPNRKKIVGWMHKNNIVVRSGATTYNPMARNPLFALADKSIVAELTLLSTHYHPSVAVFASNLLNGISIHYDGDPLIDFTQMRFLDRFVFRNPKTKDTNDGKIVRRKVYDPHGVRKLPVISKEYATKNRNEIPIDERFLHRFASMKMRMKKENEGKVAHDDDDIESVNSDEFDMLLSRFEPGERREVFNVDFSQEFSVEKRKKEMKNRKRPLESDTDGEDEADEDQVDIDEEDEIEDGSEEEDNELNEESEEEDVEEESSDEGVVAGSGRDDDSDEWDDDFAEQLGFAEDAALSADKFAAVLEEQGESQKKKPRRKTRKPHGFKKRRRR